VDAHEYADSHADLDAYEYGDEARVSAGSFGSWVQERCHLDANTLKAERTVVGLGMPPSAVAELRQAFGGRGPEANKIPISDWA
jgi:hypothetical protein